MSRVLLSPKVDFVFKRIFGNEQHPNVLIAFLNSVLNSHDPIRAVELKNSDIEKEHLEDKWGPHPAKQESSIDGVIGRLDIKAITDKGEHINIEIQLKNEYNMVKRSLYYWSKLYEGQLAEGDNYNKLAKTICINLLDFNTLPNEKFHNVYRLKECETHEELTDIMEFHFIELKKMKDIKEAKDVQTKLEAWLLFIKNPESKLIPALEAIEVEIKEAKEELVRMSSDSKERERYEKRKESMLEKVSLLEGAEQKGIEKGIELGIKKEKLEIAKSLIESGLDAEFISRTTGLTILEIEELKK